MSTGKLIVGISTLMFVIALITGVIIWIPRARKNLRRSLTISFRKGWSGFLKRLHIAGGMYVLIFTLIMSLTGLTWSFNWYRAAFYTVCGVEYSARNTTPRNTIAYNGNRQERKNNAEKKHNKELRSQVIISIDKEQAPSTPSGKLRMTIYQLHTGSWGGILTRIVWFVSAMLGATLPLTGYYIWLRKKFKRNL